MTDRIRIEGRCDPRFERVREAFAANFAEHDELGAAVAVCLDGREVVDLWGGYADPARRRPWRADTLVNVFSVGKGILGLAALVMADRGLLDLDASVAHYWPEFAAAGKGEITVRQLLSHQAGLPAVREVLEEGAMYNWSRMTTALAAQEPWWTPGTAHGYHVNTFGFLVGEVLARVSGRSFGDLLRHEISGPLGADVQVGVGPDDDARVAEFVWNPALSYVPEFDRQGLSDADLLQLHTYFNPVGASGHGVVNDVAWRRAEYPSTNGHATALGVARTYSLMATGGMAGGRRFVSDSLIAEAGREQAAGTDAVLGKPSRFGLGFQLSQPDRPIGSNEGVLLHFGAGGALGFADPVAGIGFGYGMNRMGPRLTNPTSRSLVDALYACL